jgi:hypothetical protein
MHAHYIKAMTTTAAGMPEGPIKAALNRVITSHSDLGDAQTKTRVNRDLSHEGKIKAAREALGKKAPDLIRADLTAKRILKRLDEKKAALKLPEIEPMNSAAASTRAQARDRMWGKSEKEIQALIPTMSLLQLQALIEAPELAGVNAGVADVARNRAIEILHPGKLAAIDAERDAARLLQNATSAMLESAREFSNLPNTQALNEFVNQAVPDTRAIERDVEDVTAPLAAA